MAVEVKMTTDQLLARLGVLMIENEQLQRFHTATQMRLEREAPELREKLAAIEHERWSDWQRYMHDQGNTGPNGELVIPGRKWQQWARQCATPYAELSDEEKASDMEQVDRYWPLVQEYAAQ